MELAKIFCVTRDEYDLIEDFIVYHGKIFGFNNIVIIDNMSQNPHVLDVYARYEPLGVKIYKEESYAGDDQGHAFTKYMNMYKNECKFLIGLDTDEFIYNTHSDDPMSVRQVLEELPKNATLFHITRYTWSIPDASASDYMNQKHTRPTRNITKFWDEQGHIEKMFFRSEAFVKTSVGNHCGTVNFGEEMGVQIGYFHFYNTGARRMFERARQVVDGYKYVNVNLSVFDQFIHMFRCAPWVCGYGYHKQQLYMFILFKYIIAISYALNAKRLPTETELKYFTDAYFLKQDGELINNFFRELDNLSRVNPGATEPTPAAIDGAVLTESESGLFVKPRYTLIHDPVECLEITSNIVSNFLLER